MEVSTTSIPTNLVEANIRILAYVRKLKAKGKSEKEAYNIAMEAFKKIKHNYESPIASKIGNCIKCRRAILHLIEEYTVCATSADNIEMWHTLCKDRING